MSAIGTWKLTMNTPIGKQTPTLVISEQGGAYKGTMEGPAGKVDLEDVTVEGDSFAFKADVATPMGKFNLAFKGTVDGDSISGSFDTPLGPNPFTGERLLP